MKAYSTFPMLQDYSLTIRLFSDISLTLVGGWSYPLTEMQLEYSTALAEWAAAESPSHDQNIAKLLTNPHHNIRQI